MATAETIAVGMLTAELTRVVELFGFPFMQRALVGGVLIGTLGGLLGSVTILRQLSFFSESLAHAALLGLSIGFIFGISSALILLPFAVVFALVVNYLLERTGLWTDALLNIISSSSLAIAIITLSLSDRYKGSLDSLLFGDILAVKVSDLWIGGLLLVGCVVFLTLTLRTQMILTLHEAMAIARGVSVSAHRTVFIVLLALVVAVSIKAIGVLLVSAFVVIPASASRFLTRTFTAHVLVSAGLGAISAVLGIGVSALFNLPSGPSIVVTQLAIFLGAALMPKGRAIDD